MDCGHAILSGFRGYRICSGGAKAGRVVSAGVCAACKSAPVPLRPADPPPPASCRGEDIPGWAEFLESATPEYRREADLILGQSNWTPCQRAARLRRLIERWRAFCKN